MQYKAHPVIERVSFEEVVKRCFIHLQQSFVYETVDGYRSNFEKYIKPYFPSGIDYMKLNDGNLTYWREAISRVKALGVQNKNRLLTIFKHIYDYARVYLELDNKSLLRIQKFTDDDLTPFFEKERKYITPGELGKLVQAVDSDYFKLMFMLAYTCGCRVGEIRGLTVDCYKDGKLSIVKQVQGKGTGSFKVRKLKSESSKRICYLVPAVSELLERHIRTYILTYSDFIFFSPMAHSRPCSGHYINIALNRAVKRSGLSEDIHFHLFRHSLSTYLSQSGIRSAVIADLLGHASDATTKKYYIHSTDNELEKVLDLLTRALSEPGP